MTHNERIRISARGNTHVIDITSQVSAVLERSRLRQGLLVVFVVGSTAGVTTTEAEPGLVNHDLKAFFDRIAPDDIDYQHEQTWHDDNGHSHVRAAALGPSLTVPVIDGRLTLGTWQQIVFIDFDTRPRERDLVVQILGE